MSAVTSVSPPDISAIITSLGVFSLAIAAVVGGIYKGIKDVKKGGAASGAEVSSGLLLENMTIRELSDSNRLLAETNMGIRDVLRQLCRSNEDVVEALKDNRAIVRSQIEEQHRLRAATVDLLEHIRRHP